MANGAANIVAAIGLFALAGAAAAQEAVRDPGFLLLDRHCSNCHGIGPNDKSRHPSAPTFKAVMKRYKAQMLAEALAEGLSTGHPDMPEFTFAPQEVGAIVRYLDRLSKD